MPTLIEGRSPTDIAAIRRHVGSADWLEDQGATDYWLEAGSGDLVTASGATNVTGLDSYGWTTTSVVYTNTVTADFLSSADDTPPNFSSDASGDLVRSPIIFGAYAHALRVSKTLGYIPTTLSLEIYGAFLTASANETATNMGWHNGSAVVMGVYADGTNFKLYNGSASSSAGPAVDNAYHLWRIDITGTTATWYQDNVLINTLAIVQDVWPACFNVVANTTNRWALNYAHAWYA